MSLCSGFSATLLSLWWAIFDWHYHCIVLIAYSIPPLHLCLFCSSHDWHSLFHSRMQCLCPLVLSPSLLSWFLPIELPYKRVAAWQLIYTSPGLLYSHTRSPGPRGKACVHNGASQKGLEAITCAIIVGYAVY